jgi:predicted nucleic acid-binding protein
MMNRIFLDASLWIAYRDEHEARHSDAKRIVAGLFRERVHFVTTLPVLCEIHAYFARSARRRETVLRDFWDNPVLTIEEVRHQDQKAAIELLRSQTDKTYPLCDALSFVVMRRIGVKRVLSFDEHFRQFGEFEVLS